MPVREYSRNKVPPRGYGHPWLLPYLRRQAHRWEGEIAATNSCLDSYLRRVYGFLGFDSNELFGVHGGRTGTGAEMAGDSVNAVVLAGGINHRPLFEGYTPGYKALVPLRGRPAILYPLDALMAAPQVERVCIVGPEAELR